MRGRHNLLPIIAETPNCHPYSQKWFEKVLFDNNPIGAIEHPIILAVMQMII